MMSNERLLVIFKKRETFKKYRDLIALDKEAGGLAVVVVFMNEQIEKLTEAIDEEIKSGKTTTKDLLFLMDIRDNQRCETK